MPVRVMWLCNMMPSPVAEALHRSGHNKEGWIAGAMRPVAENKDIALALVFPVKREEESEEIRGEVDGVAYYSFWADAEHPEIYDRTLESSLGMICEEFMPDVIHVYGTEYPHTLAMLRIKEWRSRVLVHIQGVMYRYAPLYYAGLNEKVTESATLRDVLRKDRIWQQKEKYVLRAENEIEALKLAENVCGRTDFDREAVMSLNPNVKYFLLNETLRPEFYGAKWEREKVRDHSIFVSQGNYPIKGLHFALEALAKVKESYPDAHLYVAGSDIVRYGSLTGSLKISAYGAYLRKLIRSLRLRLNVTFLGSLDGSGMLKQYLSSHVFLLSSVIENSPNSLGEAMIAGMPCVTADVGGIASLASDQKEVLMVDPMDADGMAEAIVKIFKDDDLAKALGENAAERALLTHDVKANYKMMLWIYESIAEANRK